MSILSFLKQNIVVNSLKRMLDKFIIPGFKGLSALTLIRVYGKGIIQSDLANRAAAISWRLFMSLFPFLLFFLILLQYLPYYSVIEEYLYDVILGNFLPPNIMETASDYISERQKNISEETQKSSFQLISISMAVFLYISTTGINALIKGLNSTQNLSLKQRTGFRQFFTALGLTVFFSILMLTGMLMIYYSDIVWKIMSEQNILAEYQESMIGLLKYISFLILFFIGISTLYYIGPKIKLTYKQIIPGAFLTTILFIIITYVFSIYITKFTKYNFLYGSVGSVMIVMLGMYFNVILILIGYELNLALAKIKGMEEDNKTIQ